MVSSELDCTVVHEQPKNTERREEPAMPPAFDLAHELAYIQEYGNDYYSFFSKEALYYVMETYGRVPRVEYYHSLREDEAGNVSLYIDAIQKTARESYAEPVSFDAPDWYTKRAEKDLKAIVSLEEQLKDASETDVFLEISPTEYDISVDERERCGFGYQSFVRLHQIGRNEQGERILVSRALREYLDAEGHAELAITLAGEAAEGGELLGSVFKLQPELSITDIRHDGDVQSVQNLIDQIYDRTPSIRKIVPPPEDLFYATSTQVREQFEKQESWLHDIFTLMEEGPDRESVAEWQAEVERQFHGWEMAMKALIHTGGDEDRALEEAEEESGTYGGGFRDTFVGMDYTPGGNSCGNGAGFGGAGDMGTSTSIAMAEGAMNYAGLSGRYDKLMGQKCAVCGLSSADEHYHCPGIKEGGYSCNKWYASELDKPRDQWTKKCTCGFEFSC